MSDAVPTLILASASTARAAVLRRAGLDFRIESAAVDEAEIKTAFRADGRAAAECALALAEAKAHRIARRHKGAFVVGADQLLVCEGAWYDKPADLAEAKKQLTALRGRRHELLTAICVSRDGQHLWHHLEEPALTMRHFTDEFLDAYLAAIGRDALASVGAYQVEGMGIQLLSRIEGDLFTILGLPLLPLLDFLRGNGIVAR